MTQTDWYYVKYTHAAQALLHPETFRYFAMFLGQEQSLANAAKILKQPVSSLKYHVIKFIEWGLVTQTRTEPRQGKPIKYYRAVADQFFIPLAQTKQDTLTDWMKFMQIPLLEQYCTDFVQAASQLHPQSANGGTCIRVIENNRISIDFSASPPPNVNFQPNSMKPLWNSWTTIHLTNTQAEKLHQEITQLWSRVMQENSQAQQNTRAYTLHLGFTPQS
jgi:hypothetical protein